MEMLDINTARSYATRANLEKALASVPSTWRYVIVCNTQGRFTAVFAAATLGGNITGAARMGFMTIG